MKNKQAQLVIKLGRKLLKEQLEMEAKDLKNLTKDCQRVIKEHLKKEKMSVNALAKSAKVHPTQLHLFIKGERGLNLTTMQKLADVISEA